MKILYLTKGDHVDYQNDCLLIGLKELFGAAVVDYNKQHHNYITYDEHEAKKLYGMGMSVSRVLPDLEVDRTDITSKIKNKYFDLVVYGSIWRCDDHLEKILKYYPKNSVVAVDGEDEINIHPCLAFDIPYFKRELIYQNDRIKPISFAIPTSKVDFIKQKTKNLAYINPFNKSTYIYNNEKDYYNDYKEARFAITTRKAGWDCMRHYEILANGSIPCFANLEQCPKQTMTHFPKEYCLEVAEKLKTQTPSDVYEQYADKFEKHLLENNTTKALATYFINTIKTL